MPGYVASGSTSQINPGSVNGGIDAISNIANRGGGPGTGDLGLNNGGNVTSPELSSVQNMAKLVSAPRGGGPGTGDLGLEAGSPVITPPSSYPVSAVKTVADTPTPPKDVGFPKTNGGNGGNGDNGDPKLTTTGTTKDRITPDQVYDAQGNFLSAGMSNIGKGAIGTSKSDQEALEYKYLLQEAPSWFFDTLGNRMSETMSQGKKPGNRRSPATAVEAAEYAKYIDQKNKEKIWLKNAREVDKPGYVPDTEQGKPGLQQTVIADDEDDSKGDDSKGVENVESGIHEASIAEVVGTDESGKPEVEIAGRTYLASEDDWTRDEFQNAWTEVQSGGGVPSWAIRTVRVPEWGINPNDKTGDLIQTMRSEISPQTQTLLDENARLAGIRQASESRQLNQYTSILQNPRAAAAMRIMEQMGLGGIAQLLGTPQHQQAAPSTPVQALQSQLLPEGMTEEQLRLRQMWGGGMIPTTGFLSGTDPDRLDISQALQSIAGFSPEQTFRSSVGVTPGVDKGYNIPRLLAMRR